MLQLLKLPDGTVKVLVEGLERARVQTYSDRTEYYEATAVALADTDANRSKPKRWRVRSCPISKAM